jgi:hypothetical protein
MTDEEQRECAVCHGDGKLYCREGCPEHEEECPHCDATGFAE